MKGIRFYEEFIDRTKRVSEKNVIAVIVVNGLSVGGLYDAICGAYLGEDGNAHPLSTSVDPLYLRKQCKRISEKRAREIHPLLFSMLDQRKFQ